MLPYIHGSYGSLQYDDFAVVGDFKSPSKFKCWVNLHFRATPNCQVSLQDGWMKVFQILSQSPFSNKSSNPPWFFSGKSAPRVAVHSAPRRTVVAINMEPSPAIPFRMIPSVFLGLVESTRKNEGNVYWDWYAMGGSLRMRESESHRNSGSRLGDTSGADFPSGSDFSSWMCKRVAVSQVGQV